MKPKRTTAAEQRVVRTAMLCWKYEPVSSQLVGYSKRWNNLTKACESLARSRKARA